MITGRATEPQTSSRSVDVERLDLRLVAATIEVSAARWDRWPVAT